MYLSRAFTDGTAHPSHDLIGVGGSCFWVLDGTTNPDRLESPDVMDYVGSLNVTLGEVTEAETGWDLKAMLAAAIWTNPDRDSGHSASIALIRLGEHTAEALVLGSATAAHVPAGGGVQLLTDRRRSRIARPERTAWRRALRNDAPEDEVDGAYRALVTAEHRARNRDGGYWVVADDPSAALRARTTTWHRNDREDHLAVFTDGIVDLLGYHFATVTEGVEHLAMLEHPDLFRLVDELHASVLEDGVRPVDDATIVVSHPEPRD